nr:MAG TPA: hypothetical protein [Caudoviricetes sp.]
MTMIKKEGESLFFCPGTILRMRINILYSVKV